MEASGDELAGVVDLFGALTRAELRQALVELAFKDGADREPSSFDGVIDAAVDSYHLVAVEATGDDPGVGPGSELFVAGPIAFPDLPDGATDLPHIMDVPDREIDRDRLGEAAEKRFRGDTARAVADGDGERMRELLDASYELEVWAPVDLAEARARLDDALE